MFSVACFAIVDTDRRPGIYREDTNEKALRMLLCQIGMHETDHLARALGHWDSIELQLLLSEVLIQLAPLW